RAEHARAAAHVELHELHPLRGLDGDAAGVEAESLPHERQRLAARGPLAMLEDDELRILRRALRHGEERAHLLLLPLGAAEHSDLHAVALRDLLPRLREILGRAEIAGHLREAARERDAFADRDATRDAGRGVAARYDHRGLERSAALVLGGRGARLDV